MRIERDSLGEVEVPEEAYFGAQTARSMHFFSIGSERMPWPVLQAYVGIKRAAAEVNAALGLLSKAHAAWIIQAADEVLGGGWEKEFPLKVWQTGSGTQTNMNVNEVLANRACELAGGKRGSHTPIHPNDHVNCSQSSNDTFPVAMHIAAAQQLQLLLTQVTRLRQAFQDKEESFASVVKIGRTHLMDALPVTLGHEFSCYKAQMEQLLPPLRAALEPLYQLPMGGTAVGTGAAAPKEFGPKVCQKLAASLHLPFVCAPNKFLHMATHDALVLAHGQVRALACALIKIATDLSWMGSGPRCGLAELFFPENEPGSSIMPGKVNPTQCEALTMVCVQVQGNDVALGIAGSRGNFELNVLKPLIIYNFLQSTTLLTDALRCFIDFFLEGIRPNTERLRFFAEHSLMLVTALSPSLGYEKAAHVAQEAFRKNISLKEACIQLGYLSAEEATRLLRPDTLLGS